MTGLTLSKPNGHAGDFDIIDKIHIKWISHEKHLQNWDHFGHWQQATQAVKNRKDFFKKLLAKIENSDFSEPTILNIGSGPCRDVYEYINENPKTDINIECLDMDSFRI